MFQPGNSAAARREAEVQVERVKAAFEQIPVASLVALVNAAIMTAVLAAAGEQPGVYLWLALSALVAALRLACWNAWRRASPLPAQHPLWSLASVGGAFSAGSLWGAGSVLLVPLPETYQLFWAFLIAGMCAGASSLHYAHLPTMLAFVIPAGLPLAIHFALDGSPRNAAAAAMIGVFLCALIVTAWRSGRHFGEMVRLRLDLAHRTSELDASNTRLRLEMAEHRNTEESLRHAQKMEAVGQLTGGIAHDFNNLLTVVLGSLALLRKNLNDASPKALSLLDNAVRGAERGAALTQRLLAFGRRQALRPEIVNLPAFVPGMSTLLGSSLGGIQVVMDLPNALAPVRVDTSQLELALLNLVVNARDAMPQGGQITISAREETASPASPYVVLSVEDTGTGMDTATLARAMEPFFTTKGIGKGTGLGLAMVHGFAAQSGGRLVLHSQADEGTLAELWLPRADATPAPRPGSAAPTPAEPPAHRPTRPCRILVVDDDPLVLASTASMLDDLGHTTVEAASGPEALACLQAAARFDLVITDYAMPGMTGLQLAQELHRRQPDLPVLLATGYAELQSAAAGIARLSKPFGQQALAQAIEASLNTAPAP